MANLFFSIGSVFISLYSFYFFGVPIVTIAGFFIIFFAKILSFRKVKYEHNISLYFIFILYITSSLSVFLGANVDVERFLVYLSFLFMVALLSVDANNLNTAYILRFFVVVHLIFFYSQFFFYYLFGIYFSVLDILGLESRNFGGVFILPWGAPLMRTSGLFSEPGTYACFMAPMIALYSRYANSAASRRLFYFALLSLALSLSTFGFVFFAIIAFFLVSTVLVKGLILIIGSIFGSSYFYWRFFIRPEVGLDSGLGFRAEYILESLTNFTTINGFFWGKGGFSINPFLFSESGADNDSGLIFYILYNFGGLAFLLCLLLVLYSLLKRDRASTVGIIILLFSKVSFFAYAFPLYFFLLLRKHYFNQ